MYSGYREGSIMNILHNILYIFGGKTMRNNTVEYYRDYYTIDLHEILPTNLTKNYLPNNLYGPAYGIAWNVLSRDSDVIFINSNADKVKTNSPLCYDLNPILNQTYINEFSPKTTEGFASAYNLHNFLYFGGKDVDSGLITNQLYVYSHERTSWSTSKVPDSIPKLAYHSAVMYPDEQNYTLHANQSVYFFGGIDDNGNVQSLTYFWDYNLITEQWRKIRTTGCTRRIMKFNAHIINDFIYIFGGADEEDLSKAKVYSDLLVLDLKTLHWTIYNIPGNGKAGYASDVIDHKLLISFGAPVENDKPEIMLVDLRSYKLVDYRPVDSGWLERREYFYQENYGELPVYSDATYSKIVGVSVFVFALIFIGLIIGLGLYFYGKLRILENNVDPRFLLNLI